MCLAVIKDLLRSPTEVEEAIFSIYSIRVIHIWVARSRVGGEEGLQA